MSDYLHENAVKKMFDSKPPASNFVFAEVTVRFPIDKDTKFPVKIFTEDDTKEMILEVLKDIKAEISNATLCLIDDKAVFNVRQIENIINQKMEEYKNERTDKRISD